MMVTSMVTDGDNGDGVVVMMMMITTLLMMMIVMVLVLAWGTKAEAFLFQAGEALMFNDFLQQTKTKLLNQRGHGFWLLLVKGAPPTPTLFRGMFIELSHFTILYITTFTPELKKCILPTFQKAIV